MQAGLDELLALARWADSLHHRLLVTPIRRYYSVERGEEMVQTSQGSFRAWM
jgi:hypothetical protein